MNTGERLAIAGVLAGGLIVGAVAVLLHHTSRPADEISAYVDEVLAATHGIERNVAGAAQLAATRELVASLRAPGAGGTG